MQILTRARRKAFDNIPPLNTTEQNCYLRIDPNTRKVLRNLKTPETRVAYLVQRAYFLTKGRFFSPKDFDPKHIKIAAKSLGIRGNLSIESVTPRSLSRQKELILDAHGWKPYSDERRKEVLGYANVLVDKQTHGEDILFALVAFCWRYRIEIPGYNEFTDLISKAFQNFEDKTFVHMERCITDHQQQLLLAILKNPPLGKKFGELKRIDQSTAQQALKNNAALLSFFRDVHTEIEDLLSELNLTDEAIRYLATATVNTGPNKIKRFENPLKKCLYLACFIRDQFYLRQDYAIDAIIKTVRSGINESNKAKKERAIQLQEETMEMQRSVTDAAKTASAIILQIDSITKNTTITHAQRIEQIRQLTEAFASAEHSDLEEIVARCDLQAETYNIQTSFYDAIFSRENSWQKSLGPLLTALSFDSDRSDKNILRAITHYKRGIIRIHGKTPMAHLKPREKALVTRDHDIPSISRYKALLFMSVERAVKDRTLTLLHSYRFRHTNSYLIPDRLWETKFEEYIAAAKLQHYVDGPALLRKIGLALTEQYASTDLLIRSSKCDSVVVDGKGRWRLRKQDADYQTERLIPELLRSEKTKNLVDILHAAEEYAPGFGDAFRHVANKNRPLEANKEQVFASIISLGTNVGHTKMDKASPDVTSKQLRDTEINWLSNNNLKRANTSIVKTIQSLPLPTIYTEDNGKLYSSSDGQKVVVAVDSLLANYSYKYYGKEQGISVNSFVDEKQSFFHVNVLSSSDREAASMMDGLVVSKNVMYTEEELEHIHITDTHGYTEAIFAGLHFLDVSFAPRIADVHDQTLYAYESKSKKKNSNYVIAPNRAVNKTLILEHWDEILHLMASIKLGYCSAALIFRMLSSANESPLYKAIKEFGRLLKSSFILKYATDVDLQRVVQKQQNRVELGQKMSKAIYFGRGGKLMVGRQEEIERSMLCMTLLKNAIILWNYCFLSDLLYKCDSDDEKNSYIESISSGSVIAWAHVNMQGTYNFKRRRKKQFFDSTYKQIKGLKV